MLLIHVRGRQKALALSDVCAKFFFHHGRSTSAKDENNTDESKGLGSTCLVVGDLRHTQFFFGSFGI